MNNYFSKAAALLAWLIGAMAIFAGGQVLLGKIPDYYVIDWLPVYNFSMGLFSFLLAAVLIWKNSRFALPVSAAILAVHALVMLILQTGYASVVAPDSTRAMIIRMTAWVIILGLVLLQERAHKRVLEKQHSPS